MCEAKVFTVTRKAGNVVPACPSGNPTKAAPHWIDGKVGRCPVAWKNCVAARDHSTTGVQGTLKPPEGNVERWVRKKNTEMRHAVNQNDNVIPNILPE